MTLNEKILFYRKQNKLSQEELAEIIGVSRQAVSKWELGEATPEVEKLLALAKVFSVTTDELLSGKPPETSSAENPLRYHISQPKNDAPHTEGEPASQQEDSTASQRQEDDFRKYGRWLGGLIRRKGYMAGYLLSFYGLGPFVIGLIATILFGQMNQAASSMMGLDPFSGLGLDHTIISADGPVFDAGNHFFADISSAASIPQTFATIIMIIGLVMIITGIILAQILKEKYKNKD